MEAIREIKKVHGRRVIVDLPVRFKNTSVEIIILPLQGKESQKTDNMEALLLSESSLKKDWGRPQEDKAWKNL